MADRRSTPPRTVPAPFDAHRVVAPPRGARAVPPAPAVHAPPQRTGPDGDAARLLRTVDALRRLQATLTGAQQALEAVISEITTAAGHGPGTARIPPGAATPPPGRPVRRTAAALPAAPDVLAEHVRRTPAADRAPRV